MTVDGALWILRIGGASIAIIWIAGILRMRAMPPFEGRGRVQAIAIAFIVVGLAAVAASFIPIGGV
jgi:hypothetical protein